jgi:triacylglycerol lipase
MGSMWWAGLSPRRRVLFVAVAALMVAVAGFVGVRVAGGGDAPSTGVPAQDQLGPVLLVPGYGGGQGALSVLADRIRTTGREARVVTLPGSGTGDLLGQVAVLAGEVEDALAHGAPSVDVIGYSAGGVVARLWVAREDGEHRARRVITLGSPLHGTRLAAAGGAVAPDACPVACQQLVPGSALLASVQEDPLPATLPWLSIWTEDDQTVVPPDSARLAGAVNVAIQQACPGVRIGHSELPTDPLVTGIVLRALGIGPLSGLAPGDCD